MFPHMKRGLCENEVELQVHKHKELLRLAIFDNLFEVDNILLS